MSQRQKSQVVHSGRVGVYHSIFPLILNAIICTAKKQSKIFNRLAEEVALSCFEQRDVHGLHMVHTSAKNNNDRALLAKVDNYIGKLSDKR